MRPNIESVSYRVLSTKNAISIIALPCVEGVKVLNALGSLSLWQCFLDILDLLSSSVSIFHISLMISFLRPK